MKIGLGFTRARVLPIAMAALAPAAYGAPRAVNDVAATIAGQPVVIAVLANDSDPDGGALSLTEVTAPGHGAASFADGVVTYTSAPGFDGIDHFLYTVVNDVGLTATAAVSVHVGDEGLPPLPPPPVLTVTPAFLDFGEVPLHKTKDLVLTVTNDTGSDVALAEIGGVSQPAPFPFDTSSLEGCNELGARVLEPGESCTQVVRFWSVAGADAASPGTMRFHDGTTSETIATVPLFGSVGPQDTGPNLDPLAIDDLAGGAPGHTQELDALRNDSDPDDDILRIVSATALHGTTEVIRCAAFPRNPNSDCIRYTADAAYTGLEAVTYTVSDGRGGTATAVYHLAIGDVVPVVAAVTPNSGSATGGQAIRITGANFLYRSRAQLRCDFDVIVPLEVGQLSDNEILATTPPHWPGVCALRVVTVFSQFGELGAAYTYTNSGTAPVAFDLSATSPHGAPVTIGLLATDPDADPLTFSVVTGPSDGSLSPLSGTQVTYTPNAGYSGPDAFTYRANDGQADSNVATVSITVTAPTSLVVSPVTGFEDGQATLAATLTSRGAPVGGQTIAFSLNQHAVGSATTGPNGVAVLSGVSLSGLPIGVLPDGVQASFAGTPLLGASTATASLTVETRDPADLSVSASVLAVSMTVGSTVTYVVSMANHGPSSTTGLRLDVTLPAGLQYVSDTGLGACSWSPGLGTCAFGALAVGATRTVNVVARPLTPGPLTAIFTVSGPRFDPAPLNNTRFATIDPQPTVTINQAPGQADPTSASPIRFSVTFSEPVTGFNASDVSFAGSLAGGGLTAAVSGSGASYTVAVTGMSIVGLVAVSIPAGAALDSFGNPSLASTSTDRTVRFQPRSVVGFVSPSNGGNVVIAIVDIGGQPSGVLSYSRGGASYTATRITSLVISGQTARFEGFSGNGRLFVATAVDGGPGQPDRFHLWIEGVAQTPASGSLSSGGLVVQPWGPDTRLRGWVDLHTHPMSNIAFGGKLFHGAPSVGSLMPAVQMAGDPECRFDDRAASIAEALSQDAPTRGDPLQSRCGNAVRSTLIKAVEAVNGGAVAPAGADGHPAFTYWPAWNDITHQKMWIDWIYRAWEGGQRVMVALSHNNRTLADLLGSGGPITGVTTDKASSDLQVDEIERLVADNSHFMAIARTPAELLSIVQGDKLAVVLGMEIDKIGDFAASGLTETLIDDEIERLYAKGVRYILPIHITDNAFGDTAIHQDLYNVVNLRENGSYFAVGCALEADGVGFRSLGFPPVLGPLVAPGAPFPPPAPGCLIAKPGGPFFLGHVNTRSPNGLTSLGEFAIRAMMRRGMLVDIDHMSDRAANRTLSIATSVSGGGYPVMSGHAGVRARSSPTVNAENSRTTTQLARIACLGGMFGLGTDGVRAENWTDQYARAYDAMRRAFGPGGLCAQSYPLGSSFIGLGTDTNSLVKTPRSTMLDFSVAPRFSPIYIPGHPANQGLPALEMSTAGTKTWNYNDHGVAHYGMFADFLRDVRTLVTGPTVPVSAALAGRQIVDEQMMYGADHFYSTWLKADAQKARVVP